MHLAIQTQVKWKQVILVIQDKWNSLSDKEKSQIILTSWRSKQKYQSLVVNMTDIEYNINNYGSVWNWTNDNVDGYWANSGNSARFDGYYLVPDLYHYLLWCAGRSSIFDPYGIFNK